MIVVRLPDGKQWLRVAHADWEDPLDPGHAARRGGRWNPPGSFPTLYLNADLDTARAQVRRLLAGSPVHPEDLDDPPWVLVTATLPARQDAADAVSEQGLRALGLPDTYPLDGRGRGVAVRRCQAIGAAVHSAGLRGVACRSAATAEGEGRELAWFPARATSRARPVGRPRPFSAWWPDASNAR